MTIRVALATKNPGKVREIAAILAPSGIEVVAPPVDWIPPEETGSTYRDNAVLKARSLAEKIGSAAIADDSGIEVDALGGAPAHLSARFAGEGATDRENLLKLIDAVRGSDVRGGRYRCVAVLASPDGAEIVTEGIVEGSLIDVPRGTGGFGYDPIFVPSGETRTMAELNPREKDAISHRGKAFWALAIELRNRVAQAGGGSGAGSTGA